MAISTHDLTELQKYTRSIIDEMYMSKVHEMRKQLSVAMAKEQQLEEKLKQCETQMEAYKNCHDCHRVNVEKRSIACQSKIDQDQPSCSTSDQLATSISEPSETSKGTSYELSNKPTSILIPPQHGLNSRTANIIQQSSNVSSGIGKYQAPESSSYLATTKKITKILDDFFYKGYDKRVRPNYGGQPVEVNVTMRILSISSVSEVQMDFTADFYFRQTWADPRLKFIRTDDIHTLFVGAEVSKKIWLPDTFFGNEKLAYFHEATTENVFLRIDHNGEVYRSIRLTVTSSCPMKLNYFPMDRQQCTIEAESYGYDVKDIIYRWAKDKAVEKDETISLPQFDIIGIEQKTRKEELSSGTYSRLIAEIHFARRMGYYLIQIYIPSSLIVVISWVSFWLHRNASPARVQLGVTTVLTMTTLMSSTNAALPKISYVKSIDIFLGTCFVMVFAALLEYATVGYLGKRIAMRKAHAQNVLSHAVAMTQKMVASKNQANLMSSVGARPSGINQQQQQHFMQRNMTNDRNHAQQQDSKNAYGTLPGSKNLSQTTQQANIVEQFLNTAAGSRVVNGKLGKAKQLDSIFGVRPSSIDKYSRVVFPVCFVCFQLMYWIVYLHISAFLEIEKTTS